LTDDGKRWVVVAEPVGANPQLEKTGTRKRRTGESKEAKERDNVGGVVVYVQRTNGNQREEVARVGFVRKTSENPKVSFKDQLDEIMAIASTTVETLNKLNPDGELV